MIVPLIKVSIWVLLALLIDLMMDLALGRPALAVVAGAPTSRASLVRKTLTTISTRMRFWTLSRPLINLCSRSLQLIFLAKDETISVLQQQAKTKQDKRKTQEAIRNYEDTGRSSFRFHPDDIGDLLHTFIIPHIRDLDNQQYYYNLNMATAKPQDLVVSLWSPNFPRM